MNRNKLIRRRQSVGRFVVGKVRGKFVVLEILAYLPRDEVIKTLFGSSKHTREYVVANRKYINNACLKKIKEFKYLDFSQKEGIENAYNEL